MRNLIDIPDFTKEELFELMDTALDIAKRPKKYERSCKGKKLATLFFEPSTRTRLSFEAAMLELGGSVIGFSDSNSSSTSKGESISDTAKIVSKYADIIAMRHFLEGAPLTASFASEIPVINAGDGGHCHPTQTLADIFTIRREKGRFDGLVVGFCGDLKYGRTVHSLLSALSLFENIKVVLISPDELKLPEHIKSTVLSSKGIEFKETVSLEDALPELDVLYMTRIQRERFDDKEMYERLKDSYVLTLEKLDSAKKDLCILHPLPRVNEISVKVDDDPRACYFKQAENGKYMRKALILKLLSKKYLSANDERGYESASTHVCENQKCITQIEQEITPLFFNDEFGTCRCAYCESAAVIKEDK